MRSAGVTLLLASAVLGGVSGFVLPSASTQVAAGASNALFSTPPTSTGWDSFERLSGLTDMPSGEEQRKFRRTVYTHDDWKKHRNQNRFIVYLAAIFKSGVYKNLQGEVFLTTGVAAVVCFWNALFGGYTDLLGHQHAALIASDFLPKLGLPMNAFTLTSPSLGLLLGTLLLRMERSAMRLLLLSQIFLTLIVTPFSCFFLTLFLSVDSVPNQHFLPTLGRSS